MEDQFICSSVGAFTRGSDGESPDISKNVSISFRINVYQDPSSLELTHASITSYEKIFLDEIDGEVKKLNLKEIKKDYCGSYNSEKYNKCILDKDERIPKDAQIFKQGEIYVATKENNNPCF